MQEERRTSLINNKPFLILLAVFLLLFTYVAYSEYSRFLASERYDAAAIGYRQGMTGMVAKLFRESDGCRIVPVFLGNETKEFIDVSCLRRSGTNNT